MMKPKVIRESPRTFGKRGPFGVNGKWASQTCKGRRGNLGNKN